jgi:hypothetical protein
MGIGLSRHWQYCLTRLRGVEALSRDRAISGWQGKACPLWVFWLPAMGWGGAWALCGRARRDRPEIAGRKMGEVGGRFWPQRQWR